MLPRISWYQVNYESNINKNGMRKYLAYTIKVPTNEQGGVSPTVTTRRKRRAIETSNGTVFDPNNFELEIGTQSECPEPRNRNIPCNGPVPDNQNYRFQLTVGKVGEEEEQTRSNRTGAEEDTVSGNKLFSNTVHSFIVCFMYMHFIYKNLLPLK